MWPFYWIKNMNERQLVLDKIFEYFQELNYNNVLIYGSYVEIFSGFDFEPNDIDVMIVVDDEPPEPRHKTFYLNSITSLPINVEFMKRTSFKLELNSLQPKYFNCKTTAALQKDIDFSLSSKLPHEIRSCISSISSKAFDKGKKKLTVDEDFDEVLGLKNILHAFKFPLYAKWYYVDDSTKQFEIQTLNSLRVLIKEIYDDATGTKEEKVQQLMGYIKPIYNQLMTEFRIQFPKMVNKC